MNNGDSFVAAEKMAAKPALQSYCACTFLNLHCSYKALARGEFTIQVSQCTNVSNANSFVLKLVIFYGISEWLIISVFIVIAVSKDVVLNFLLQQH